MESTDTYTTRAATGPFTPNLAALGDIARQLGEVRIYLDLGSVPAARAQVVHTQALVLEMVRTARLDAVFPGT